MSEEKRSKILFLNVGWMKRYEGPAADDPTRGPYFGRLNRSERRQHGHECYNFSDRGGFCFGAHPGSVGTDIQKLGGRHGSESVDEVLVVWFSRNPRTGKAVIVGWYEHATVYRIFRKPRRGEGHSLYGEPISYKAKARYRDCKLLNDTDSDRSFPIPNRFEKAGGYGQSPNWYGLGTDFLEKVWKYILDLDGSHKATRPGKPTAPPVNNDPILKLLVEQNAIRVATEFYNSPAGGSRKVESVERENLGWDLDAIGEHDTLKVEVKGVSAQEPIAELTPNEFARMNEHNSFWVLFIVTNCLSQKPKSFEFRYMHDANRWETADGGILSIRQKVAAVVTLMPS